MPVEVRSALSHLARENTITARECRQAEERLAVLRTGWREVMPSDKLRDIAETLPDIYALPAMDALQLAAALVWCFEKPKGRLFVCTDVSLREAAEKADFTILP